MFKKTFILLLFSLFAFAIELQKPKIYQGNENISGWVMSEKLDGIRGYWNGSSLQSRKGKKIHAPEGFTANFPPFELDGELWIKRGSFEQTQSIVMDKNPSKDWQKITYNVFEVPNTKGDFIQRLEKAKRWFEAHPNQHVRFIEQTICKDREQLESFLNAIIVQGGEGIIIKNPSALYRAGRSDQILKVKRFEDMEGEVLKVTMSDKTPRIASLTLKLPDGKVFKLGSGFDTAISQNPPKIGQKVTFRYYGLSARGIPKFAVFMRVRED